MPIYDYECSKCGEVRERIAGLNDKRLKCPKCGGTANRIITASGHFCSNEDAGWIKSVLEVVDTGPDASASDRRFAKNPTRANYKRWMKDKGLRPLESGERTKPPATDTSSLEKKVMERHIKRNRIEI